MTITTTTTPAPGQSTHDHATRDYADYLDTLRYVKDRETAAQVLDSMVAAAAATARLFRDIRQEEELAPSGTRRERLTALSALASGAWQNAALGWAEAATLLHLLACAMRGYSLEVAEFWDNRSWGHDEWELLAQASSPLEFAAAFDGLRAELTKYTTLPPLGETGNEDDPADEPEPDPDPDWENTRICYES